MIRLQNHLRPIRIKQPSDSDLTCGGDKELNLTSGLNDRRTATCALPLVKPYSGTSSVTHRLTMEGRGRYQLQPQLSVSVPHLTKLGGATGVRTPDLIAASDALSQLSYNPLVDVSCRLRCHLTTCCLSSLITSVLFSCTHSYDLSNNVQCRSVSFASSSCDSHPREQQRTQLNRALLSCSGKPSTDKGIWRRMWESNPRIQALQARALPLC